VYHEQRVCGRNETPLDPSTYHVQILAEDVQA